MSIFFSLHVIFELYSSYSNFSPAFIDFSAFSSQSASLKYFTDLGGVLPVISYSNGENSNLVDPALPAEVVWNNASNSEDTSLFTGKVKKS